MTDSPTWKYNGFGIVVSPSGYFVASINGASRRATSLRAVKVLIDKEGAFTPIEIIDTRYGGEPKYRQIVRVEDGDYIDDSGGKHHRIIVDTPANRALVEDLRAAVREKSEADDRLQRKISGIEVRIPYQRVESDK